MGSQGGSMVGLEPFVGHHQMAFVACHAPGILDFPFPGVAVLIQIHSHKGHGVGRAAGAGEDSLALVHTEGCSHE